MLNYLYCLDENYNIQAANSIYSLLKNNSEDINVYIIHKNPESFKSHLDLINKKFKKLNYFIYKFDEKNIEFPNIDSAHVSEATYYRFFLDEYLPEDLNEVIYIDADIICLKDSYQFSKKYIKEVVESDYIVGVKTEWEDNFIKDGYHDEFYRLGLESKKYFNAGVMFIDLKKWRKEQIKNRLLQKQEELKGKIVLWDQDVLNSFFDGRYIEINKYLNFNVAIWVDMSDKVLKSPDIKENDLNNIIFVHYSGKSKPWSVKGALHASSKFYHDVFYELYRKRYHISNNWKSLAMGDFLMALRKREVFKLTHPISFIFSVLKFLLLKR